MKVPGAAAMMMAMGTAWAGSPTSWTVVACLNYGSDAAVMYRAEGAASKLLSQAGVKLVWRSGVAACADGAGLVVTLSRRTAPTDHPGALAYALPFEKTHIVLFCDRAQNAASATVTPFLVGYVLAHEVTHMLQGVDRHADSGVMKACWNAADYADMVRMRLRFTGEDVSLIRQGMEWRNRTARTAAQ